MTYDSAYDIVKKYHHAWTSGDVEQAMECVADDIICHAPGGDLEGKDVYQEFIGAFARYRRVRRRGSRRLVLLPADRGHLNRPGC